jgi:hypothetical protein
MRYLENKENAKNMDSQSIQLTNSKYGGGARSPKISDSQSMMTGKKGTATQRGVYINISDQKGILSNSGIKQIGQSAQPRKTVIFKHPDVDPQQEGYVEPFNGIGAGIGGSMFKEVTEHSD